MALDLPTDWRGRLLERVYEQFKSTRWAPALANSLGRAGNDFQAAAVAMLSLLSIDPITDDATSPAYGIGRGVQLDRIGRLVGQQRSGEDDAHYRLYLRARVAANKSDGTPDVLIGVMMAMFGEAASRYAKPVFARGGNKAFTLRLRNPTTDREAEIARLFLGYAQGAGDRGILVSQVEADTAMFTFPVAAYAAGGVSIGDVAIDVTAASTWPSAGSFTIDQGLADEEELTYTSRNNAQLFLAAGAANAHGVGAALVLSGGTGKGFPTATYVASGASPGDPSIDVPDSSAFNAGDVVVIDEGLATEETTTVSGTAPALISVTPDLTQPHPAGAAIVVVGSGGRLARAHEG